MESAKTIKPVSVATSLATYAEDTLLRRARSRPTAMIAGPMQATTATVVTTAVKESPDWPRSPGERRTSQDSRPAIAGSVDQTIAPASGILIGRRAAAPQSRTPAGSSVRAPADPTRMTRSTKAQGDQPPDDAASRSVVPA